MLHPEIRFAAFLAGMQRKGIGAKLNDAGRDAKVRQWIARPEILMGPLFEPTLAKLPALALRTLECAALLPKDHLPLAWLRTLIEQDADTGPLLAHDPDDADPWFDALRLLADRQLLHSAPDAAAPFPLGRMHQILQDVLLARMQTKGNYPATRDQVAQHLGRRAEDIYRSQQPPSKGELNALMAALPPALAAQPNRDLANAAMFLVEKVMVYRSLAAARALLNAAHAVISDLAASDPANAAWQRDLSVSQNWLGNLAVAQGDLPAAARHFSASMKIWERLAASDLANAEWQRDLWVSHWRVANLLEKQGDAAVQQHWRAAHDILAGMVQAGLHVSPQDRGFLEGLRAKVGG